MHHIEEKYGMLHGIIHAAGLIRDSFLLKKDIREAEEVMNPKVKGLVNLDRASRKMKLDHFILFSSFSGVLGNAGQADYAAANGFMDAYARYRNREVSENSGYGKTVSIDWPLWKEGGIKIDEATEKMIRQRTGMAALRTPDGIRAMYLGMIHGKDQVIVMEGDMSKCISFLKANGIKIMSTRIIEDKKESTGDDYYLNLYEKIAQGELSEEELEHMIRVPR
jgi:polyketide synthase PksN